MPRMIPVRPRAGANISEKRIFTALEGVMDSPDWIVIHSLSIARHLENLAGEADFIVMVPGKGVLVIEAKSPAYVEYTDGAWHLDRTPKPGKDPLKQLDGARGSIRSFLINQAKVADGSEPFARLLWFTSLGRHQFENRSPGDMQFFEWELGWSDDLTKPVWLIEKVLDEHNAHLAEVEGVKHDPTGFTAEKAQAFADALLSDFAIGRTRADDKRDRLVEERRLLDEQHEALDMVEDNDHVYFDGPAGTGKSFLIASAARRFSKQGKKTLVVCWNVLMADELRTLVGRPEIEVADFNSLMLQLSGLDSNPEGAADDWYRRELPERALAALAARPFLGAFAAICVDEFQDVAGNPLLLQSIFALTGNGSGAGTHIVLAGDDHQQILRTPTEQQGAYAIAKAAIPDLVRARVRQNCRTVPAIVTAAEKAVGHPLGFTGHRMSPGTPGGVASMRLADGEPATATTALASALRDLLKHHDAEDIVVLSPFGAKSSLAGSLLARTETSQDERWLGKQLESTNRAGKIRWRSVFKFKGLEAEAVVLTDFGPDARAWIESTGNAWEDVLYVAMTRGKYRCVVLEAATER